MRRHWRHVLFVIICIGFTPIAFASCKSDSGGSGAGSGSGSGSGDSGGTAEEIQEGTAQSALTTADFPDVGACADRNTLPANQTFLATMRQTSHILHTHHQYDFDTDLPAVCGLDGSWDPDNISDALDTERRACNVFTNVPQFFEDVDFAIANTGGGTPGICRNGFGFFGADDNETGFPTAATYRMEGCIEENGNSYSMRVRITVTGDSADKLFATVGVSNAADLSLHDESGDTVESEDDFKDMIVGSPGSFTMTIRSGSTTHLSVQVELICIQKLDAGESCPDGQAGVECPN